MKKNKLYFLLFILFSNISMSQNIKDKKVLVVWGGWEGHKPELFATHVEKWLISQKADYIINNGLDIYDNYDELIKYDLIIQSVTMSEISKNQEENLVKAILNGVGIAGAHGGLVDSFRNSTNYQFMIGGQWVSHPGGIIKYKVSMLDDELTKGLSDFEILSEQYYMHYDPNVKIIANTKFNGEVFPWINDVVMPIAWKKTYGKGKVFFISIGHDPDEFMLHKDGWELLTRGFLWAVR
tara:strand:+ start:1534 stop:2247 length:714 start_codon:yes stop_codon:yes gene_type:complete